MVRALRRQTIILLLKSQKKGIQTFPASSSFDHNLNIRLMEKDHDRCVLLGALSVPSLWICGRKVYGIWPSELSLSAQGFAS